MRTHLAIALIASLAGSGAAIAQRADVSRMSCAAAAALVQQSGAVVVTTGPATYDRVVRDQGFCPKEETTAPAWVHTADTPACFVGYRCKDKFNEGYGRD